MCVAPLHKFAACVPAAYLNLAFRLFLAISALWRINNLGLLKHRRESDPHRPRYKP